MMSQAAFLYRFLDSSKKLKKFEKTLDKMWIIG